MELPVIVEWARFFDNGFALINANVNPYSERYSNEMEEEIEPYISKKYNTLTITASLADKYSSFEDMRGGQFIFIGNFKNHPKYGPQFKSEFFYKDVPATKDGLKVFLMTLPNIKEKRSESIIEKFGIEGTFDILDNNIYRLVEINGITAQRIPAIEKAWADEKCLRELYEFFVSKNLPPKLARASYKKWGQSAKLLIKENPYKLAELKGVGFVTADQFAHQILDIVPDDFRTTACMRYAIEDGTRMNGNLCIPYGNLKRKVCEIIAQCDRKMDKQCDINKYKKLVSICLKDNLKTFSVIKDLESKAIYVYIKRIWDQERFIAQSLYKRSKTDNQETRCTTTDLIEAEKDVSEFLEQEIKLDECQKEAIQTAFDHKVSIITGAGGTGKSLICRCIFKLAQEKGMSIRMMSPTGKAAQVLESKTGCGASTIHRGLKMVPGEEEPRESITEDILLIDEISMCGIDTMNAIMQALSGNIWGHVVFVGDKNQLPSVSPGNFLSDIIASGIANVVFLDKIHRQSQDSYISLVANDISKGRVVEVPEGASDITWYELNVSSFHADILKFLDNYLESNEDINDLQIISPMKKGSCGVFKLNEIIQTKMAEVNGTTEQKLQLNFNQFYVGDRVIQTKNNYNKMIFNGDMGTIIDLGEKIFDPLKNDQKEKFITVDFYGEEITFIGDEIEQLYLAWCITVHKFQGSQSPFIVFVMASEAQVMMSKELVYTAFTRAENQLYIFGHTHMMKLSPTRSITRKRYTNFEKIVKSLRTNKRLIRTLSL